MNGRREGLKKKWNMQFLQTRYVKQHLGKQLMNIENLRDHMDDLELIFTMLGEASTTKIARNRNTLGFPENKSAARKGGKIAGDARKKLELESGEKVVTPENYLVEPEVNKRKKLKGQNN